MSAVQNFDTIAMSAMVAVAMLGAPSLRDNQITEPPPP